MPNARTQIVKFRWDSGIKSFRVLIDTQSVFITEKRTEAQAITAFLSLQTTEILTAIVNHADRR